MTKKKAYWVVLVLLLYIFIEGSSYLGLYLLKEIRNSEYAPSDVLSRKHRKILTRVLKGEARYLTYHPVFGWTIKENGIKTEDEDILYHANSQGIRGNQEYKALPPHNVLRIASFGDSYTHSDGVKNHETWQEQLAGLHQNLQVLNFGVSGFGTDQAFLRYQQDGIQYHSHISFIGFMSENIFRHVNVFRPFYSKQTGVPFAKPRFTVQSEELKLLANPLSELSEYQKLLTSPKTVLSSLGANDYYYPKRYKSGVLDFYHQSV